MHAEEIAKGS